MNNQSVDSIINQGTYSEANKTSTFGLTQIEIPSDCDSIDLASRLGSVDLFIIAMGDEDMKRLDGAIADCGLPARTAKALRKRVREVYAPVLGVIKDLSRDSFIAQLQNRRMKILEAMSDLKIDDASLRDLAVSYGVLQDKEALLKGDPTSIVSIEDRRTMGELSTAMVEEAKRREAVELTKQADGSYAE